MAALFNFAFRVPVLVTDGSVSRMKALVLRVVFSQKDKKKGGGGSKLRLEFSLNAGRGGLITLPPPSERPVGARSHTFDGCRPCMLVSVADRGEMIVCTFVFGTHTLRGVSEKQELSK